ncbi:MAG: prepilin-type N-terminal cleavage/methylation domain-containing protein [Caldisericaceae bacterium]
MKKGFTLIELMIAIAIIIILAAIIVQSYFTLVNRSRVAVIEYNLKAIATALEAFKTNWTKYPVYNTSEANSWAYLKVELTGTGTGSGYINVSSAATITGEKGGIQYITLEALKSLEIKSNLYNGSGSITYTSDGNIYTLTVIAVIDGKTYTFTMLPGGQITVSSN